MVNDFPFKIVHIPYFQRELQNKASKTNYDLLFAEIEISLSLSLSLSHLSICKLFYKLYFIIIMNNGSFILDELT